MKGSRKGAMERKKFGRSTHAWTRVEGQQYKTPLAYHFEKPMIVTNVGALPDYVPHEKAGLVTEANAASIAESIERYFELGETYVRPEILKKTKKKSKKDWDE